MRAGDIAEPYPVVGLDTPALEAARLIARDRLPGLVVTRSDGTPKAVLPASEVVRFMVPDYVQDDPALAGVLGEVPVQQITARLQRATVADLVSARPVELAVLNTDDTVVELAEIMARLRSPLCAVVDGTKILGVVTAARLLELVCGDDLDDDRRDHRLHHRLPADRHRTDQPCRSGPGRCRGDPRDRGGRIRRRLLLKETGIDWNVIFLLFGMMVIVGVLKQTGVFEYVAIWAAKKAKGRPFRVMTLLCLITAVASAGLDNVTTVLLIAPVTLLVCGRSASGRCRS